MDTPSVRESGGPGRPRDPSGSRRSDPEASANEAQAQGRWVARTGIGLVNTTEKLICGSAAMTTPAAAEALAILGRRAASCVVDSSAVPPSPSANVPWVLHRASTAADPAGPWGAFDLVPHTGQAAVDHCLVAHLMAKNLGLAGACTLDGGIIEALHSARLPKSDRLATLLGDDPRPAYSGAPAPQDGNASEGAGDVEPESILKAAEVAFRAVAEHCGRPLGPLATYDVEDADTLILTVGVAARVAREVAEQRTAAGQPTGVVALELLRPLPKDALGKLLSGRRTIVVIEPSFVRFEARSLLTTLKAAGCLGSDAIGLSGERAGLNGRLQGALAGSGNGESLAAASTPAPGKAVALAAAPAGTWSDEVLLDSVAGLGGEQEWALRRPSRVFANASVVLLSQNNGAAGHVSELDALFVTDPALIGPRGPAARLRRGGSLLLAASASSAEELWAGLSQTQRTFVAERELAVHWASPGPDGDTEGTRQHLHSALQTCFRPIVQSAGLCPQRVPGASESLRSLDTQALSSSAPHKALALGTGGPLPKMPLDPDLDVDAQERQSVRAFHVGAGQPREGGPLPAMLKPAVLPAVLAEEQPWRAWPLVLMDSGEAMSSPAVTPLCAHVLAASERLAAEGETATAVQEHIARLIGCNAAHLAHRTEGAPFAEAFDEAGEAFVAAFDISAPAKQALRAELGRLKSELPSSGSLLGLGPHTLLALYAFVVHRARQERLTSTLAELQELQNGLDNLLRADDAGGPQAADPATVAATIGGGVTTFIDSEALAKTLPKRRGGRGLSPERRARIEAAAQTLEGFAQEANDVPSCIFVDPGALALHEAFPGARVVGHSDALGAAVGLFDGYADWVTQVVRATRIARLEVAGEYDPSQHDEMFARLSWQGLTADELRLVPPVVAVETAARLRSQALTSLSELLRSGRPVQVLVSDGPAGLDSELHGQGLATYHPGLGYLAVAHREAFVLQSSLAEPDHLVSGFQRMTEALRPAVALVATPSWETAMTPEAEIALAVACRDTPCFCYDPDADTSWAGRFDLSANPEPEALWPSYDVPYVDAEGDRTERREAFTFAHLAAVHPSYQAHLRVIPVDAWDDEQVELTDYLALLESGPPPKVPFIWVVDANGNLARAVITRELAYACRDRVRAWRILQELGGINNEYARLAAEEARAQAQAQATEERRQLEAEHAQALERVGQEAAGDAMRHLAAVLMNMDTVPAGVGGMPAPSPTAPQAAAPATAEAEESAPAPQEEEEEEVSFSEAYIDTALCTTCNDCTNLNPVMFKYDGNKQAFIADINAGTFAQLVIAAEKCPARCIHPGAPRGDDETATAEMVTRAAPFN